MSGRETGNSIKDLKLKKVRRRRVLDAVRDRTYLRSVRVWFEAISPADGPEESATTCIM
jgi:hypothetical protein